MWNFLDIGIIMVFFLSPTHFSTCFYLLVKKYIKGNFGMLSMISLRLNVIQIPVSNKFTV